jgi:hypothetical protein
MTRREQELAQWFARESELLHELQKQIEAREGCQAENLVTQNTIKLLIATGVISQEQFDEFRQMVAKQMTDIEQGQREQDRLVKKLKPQLTR